MTLSQPEIRQVSYRLVLGLITAYSTIPNNNMRNEILMGLYEDACMSMEPAEVLEILIGAAQITAGLCAHMLPEERLPELAQLLRTAAEAT